MPLGQMMKSNIGPSEGLMNKYASFNGGRRTGGDQAVALSSQLNQGEGRGMFAGMKNFFGGQKDPYQRLTEMGYGAPADSGQIQPVGQPMMEPPPQGDPQMGAPMGGARPFAPPPQAQGNMFGRMKQAMMNRPPQQPMPQMQGSMFNRRPMPQQPQPQMGNQMRRPMGGGIGPSMI